MIKKVFIWTSPLPLLTFCAAYIYNKRFDIDGWMLIPPIILSLSMGTIGLLLIVQAYIKKKTALNLWISTLIAGSLFLYVLAGRMI
jgi:hypothetical protein